MTKCFECGKTAEHDHHVVPRSLGGTKTVPLCLRCHTKVHGKNMAAGSLIKAGIERAKTAGKKFGGSKKGRLLSVTPEQIKQIRWLYTCNTAVTDIARFVGVSRPTVYRFTENPNEGVCSRPTVYRFTENPNEGVCS